MADRDRWRGGSYRMFYAPRYDALVREYQAAQEENLKQAKRHRGLAAEAGQ
ncbi:MAG: hypothetical protein LC776_06080 [Acidobacteria bacterium]|nr:hypothetical protein [Acidobacteriota bacterium]